MQTLARSFADPVIASQQTFRTVMDVMARPGRIARLSPDIEPPPPLCRAAGAIALTLVDFETKVWLDAPLTASPEVARWLRFHAGAPITPSGRDAAFAFVSDARALPSFAEFSAGTPEYPDRSTTLIVEVESLTQGTPLRLTGPGIAGAARLAPSSLPADFAVRWESNRALFPCGVDVILVAGDSVAALPRSARISHED